MMMTKWHKKQADQIGIFTGTKQLYELNMLIVSVNECCSHEVCVALQSYLKIMMMIINM